MELKTIFITPPFTQLNTPYPATAYLKGFFNTKNWKAYQVDLGIEVILELFTIEGLEVIFSQADEGEFHLDDNCLRILSLKEEYINTIAPVISFLQHKNPTLAHSICTRNYLPEANRFKALDNLEWAFGTMGIQDKARHLATLYLEDISDLIKSTIDPRFGFSRYAERLGRTATHFDEMDDALLNEETIIDDVLCQLLESKIEEYEPDFICLTVPFPGNLYAALKCGQFIKNNFPNIKIAMGGGYCNTELRSLYDERIFNYIDFISLDDGEKPLEQIMLFLNGDIKKENLKRTFFLDNGVVQFIKGEQHLDISQRETGTPDYSDLLLDEYLSVLEILNPMHRLWSDGRWNKLTLAHGCYWGKCTFCDVTLDYIQRYEPINAAIICDRIEEIIEQTDQNGFHFVDEAAPPALMRDLALEIIRRNLTVVWWTNIRFENSFTYDLCQLLKASGCIAISGGLEVASDRLLDLIKKGVSVAQVARVTDNFTRSDIMVHAYLMYGFPTQTAQETIDSLEMVRQLIQEGAIQSGFWHQFAMTAHSPVGLNPEAFNVERIGPNFGGFADNDLYHNDPSGANHELFSEGLKKSLFNYMHGIGFDFPLKEWFDFDVPHTTIPKRFIRKAIKDKRAEKYRKNAIILWLGKMPYFSELENGRCELIFHLKQKDLILEVEWDLGNWLFDATPNVLIGNHAPLLFSEFKNEYEKELGDFTVFEKSKTWRLLRENGLLVL